MPTLIMASISNPGGGLMGNNVLKNAPREIVGSTKFDPGNIARDLGNDMYSQSHV